MWLAIKSIFWTVVVCTFILLMPVLGFIMMAGTIFYVVREVIEDKDYDDEEEV